ncbi:redox-sensitive bicupin YhaK (pirin superfamily) [Microbacterium sp. W4I4]|uniref:pirin family protein n=1 Tax=Microbacterium sp. W4I4 TaxID=3042295 RepID=UPI0027839DAA|nr:pirin family protein [Microbacterium sp. W4I4]MDQ0613028.1 redox-sensitive bicupin YhaK (pirin superfamily) [Microbacterium sp. W4I4]
MTNLEKNPPERVLEPGELCRDVEVLTPREVPLGGPRAMTVYRTLPQKQRSLVGAWCFLDHYGPDDVASSGGMVVPRHPHTGLATVSWLFTGRIDHLDSSGVEAAVLPGELNLMIAGSGITHQEVSAPETTVLHGVQLWYAMPEATRFSEHAFAHYAPEPVELSGITARVFIGSLLGSTSPVETRTPDLLGAELIMEPGAEVVLEVRADFEHAALAETGSISLNGTPVQHRELGYTPLGADSVRIAAGAEGARVILLGGVPLGEQIVMWWNFIGRSHDEIVEFRRRYQSELGFEPSDPMDADKPALFGPYPEGELAPLPAPPMPTVTLRPRE